MINYSKFYSPESGFEWNSQTDYTQKDVKYYTVIYNNIVYKKTRYYSASHNGVPPNIAVANDILGDERRVWMFYDFFYGKGYDTNDSINYYKNTEIFSKRFKQYPHIQPLTGGYNGLIPQKGTRWLTISTPFSCSNDRCNYYNKSMEGMGSAYGYVFPSESDKFHTKYAFNSSNSDELNTSSWFSFGSMSPYREWFTSDSNGENLNKEGIVIDSDGNVLTKNLKSPNTNINNLNSYDLSNGNDIYNTYSSIRKLQLNNFRISFDVFKHSGIDITFRHKAVEDGWGDKYSQSLQQWIKAKNSPPPLNNNPDSNHLATIRWSHWDKLNYSYNGDYIVLFMNLNYSFSTDGVNKTMYAYVDENKSKYKTYSYGEWWRKTEVKVLNNLYNISPNYPSGTNYMGDSLFFIGKTIKIDVVFYDITFSLQEEIRVPPISFDFQSAPEPSWVNGSSRLEWERSSILNLFNKNKPSNYPEHYLGYYGIPQMSLSPKDSWSYSPQKNKPNFLKDNTRYGFVWYTTESFPAWGVHITHFNVLYYKIVPNITYSKKSYYYKIKDFKDIDGRDFVKNIFLRKYYTKNYYPFPIKYGYRSETVGTYSGILSVKVSGADSSFT